MSPNEKTVQYQGQTYPSEPVRIVSSEEHSNRYMLEDGNSLDLRLVVIEVRRVVGARDADGRPIYRIESHNIATVKGTS